MGQVRIKTQLETLHPKAKSQGKVDSKAKGQAKVVSKAGSIDVWIFLSFDVQKFKSIIEVVRHGSG